MKFSMKRLAAFVLALVMVLGLMPVMNNAANAVDVTGLNDTSIGLSYVLGTNPGGSTWNANGNTLDGTAVGKTAGSRYMPTTNTLTITNNKSSTATLSFDYSISGTFGSVAIDGTTYKAATTGSFSKELEPKATVVIKLTTKMVNGSSNAVNIAITKLALTLKDAGPVTTTFEAPAHGTYTVAYGSESFSVAAGSASQTATNLPDVMYTLTAEPGEGYKLVGWYNVTTGKYLSDAATFEGYFEEASTVKAVVAPNESAVFLTNDNYYTDLNEAVAYAQANPEKLITLIQSGVLAVGDYTVPAGITLLIPMDSEYTPTRTDDPDFVVAPEYIDDVATPYAYLTLTMAEGANLIVNGTLDVESKHSTLKGSRTTGGRPYGAYGAICMNPESNITVNDGGNLYAWGYVYGDGTVTANSGAQVYEIMQVTDFPGGSNMSMFVDTDPTFDADADGNPANDYIRTFPFSQYYVQNIEVALTLNAGATEFVYMTMTAGGKSMGLPVRFIGEGGMFNPGEGGSIVKDYDPSTDRLNVTVDGDATMAGIALDLTGTQYEEAVAAVLSGVSKVDSATFILTLNGNISIDIASGTTTIKQDLHLLPGVEISVDEDATLIVDQRTYADDEYDTLTVFGSYTGYNIYVWDLENWGNYVFSSKQLVPVAYSPTTGRYVRTAADLKDVVIDINGTVITNGYVYSTVSVDSDTSLPVSGGANIISSGKTGKVILQNGAGFEVLAFCLDGKSNVDNAVDIDSLWLKNGDGTFELTAGAEAGTTYLYCEGHDCWYTEGHKDRTVEITWIINGNGGAEEYTVCSFPSYKGGTPSKPANGCTNYIFAGWATSADGEVLEDLPIVENDAVYFAVFVENTVHNWQDADCDTPKTCSGCGATMGSALGHSWDVADCDTPKTCSVCGETVGAALGHSWNAATCTAPKTCSICGDTEGSALGHRWNAADCDTPKTCAGCGATEGTSLGHSWNAADCDTPKTCSVCGATTGSALGHSWDAADCDTPKTCSVCGDTEGSALGHSWDAADCDSPKTCSVCGATDGAALGHSWLSATCKVAKTCSVCGATEGEPADCEDYDQNHLCDYAGCGDKLTDCEDGDDRDHDCDFTGCDQTNVDDGHHGGTAYCNAKKVCVECGLEYGTTDGSNHAYSNETYYGDVTETTHTVYYSCCGGVKVTEPHKYVSGICDCNAQALVQVTMGGVVSYYNDLAVAFEAVSASTSKTTVVKILKNVDVGSTRVTVSGGTFTLDLNGKAVSGTGSEVLSFKGCDVTIQDSVGTATVSGKDLGECITVSSDATVTIQGGTYKSYVISYSANLHISGGVFEKLVKFNYKTSSKWSNGTISGNPVFNGQVAVEYARLIVTGGTMNAGFDMTYGNVTLSGGVINSEAGRAAVQNRAGTLTITGDVVINADKAGVSAGQGTTNITGGTITGGTYGVSVSGTTVNISGGKISGTTAGVYVYSNTTNITGGEISGNNGVYVAAGSSTVNIKGGKITGTEVAAYTWNGKLNISGGSLTGPTGVYIKKGTTTITGGTISATYKHIYDSSVSGDNGTVVLGVGENGVGATFVNGIQLYGDIKLNGILAEGVSYWAGNTMLWDLADTAATISDKGDITVKTSCDHADAEYEILADGTHTATCDCSWYSNEAHDFGENHECVCGKIETFTITWSVNGNTTTEPYEYGATPSFKGSTDKAADGCTVYTFDGWDKAFAAVTGDVTYTAQYTESKNHSWNDATCTAPKTCSACGDTEGEALGHGHTEGWDYNVYEDTHEVVCLDCQQYSVTVGHQYTEPDHTCVCGAIEQFTLTMQLNGGTLTEEGREWLIDTGWTISDTYFTRKVPYEAIWYFELDGMFVKEGYVYVGAVDQDGNSYTKPDIVEIVQDMTFTVTWAIDTYTVTWVVDGVTTTETYKTGDVPSFSGSTDKAADGCTVYTFDGWDKDIVAVTGDVTYTAQYTESKSHTGEVDYTNNGDGTHNGIYECCNTPYETNAPHDYSYDVWKHKCGCGAVEEFKLAVVYGVNGEYTYEAMVPYWTPMADLDVINNIPWTIYVKDATRFGHYSLEDFYWDMDRDGDLDADRYFTEGYMPAFDMYVDATRYKYVGWANDGIGWQFHDYYSGIIKNNFISVPMAYLYEDGSYEEIEGFYLVDANGYRVENGLGRFYYLGENPYNGVNYAPNAEDIAYYENKGLTFIDKEMTWYYFGDDGKWQYNYTGLVGDSYVVNGQAAWHVGLVEIDGDYYYFKGDEVNGGNVMVTGDYYIGRNNTDKAVVIGGLYTFDNDGVMQMFHSIVESELFEGKRYYVGGQLMLGAGLVDLYTVATGVTNYFYVNAYGNLIVDAEYYIGANSFGIDKGIYYFDESGFMVIPEKTTKEGLHFEDGKWYYYVDGAKAYCAGLIEIDGNLVYVKSDGSLATGVYYVTNTNGNEYIASGTKCTFNDNGVLIDPIVGSEVLAEGGMTFEGCNWTEEEVVVIFTAASNGKLIINVTGITAGNGFMYDIHDVNAGGWLGENYHQGTGTVEFDVQVGREYWVYVYPATEADDEYWMVEGTVEYEISVVYDGVKDGIVNGYYYVDGQIAYAAGLIEIDGNYYYVRSNGQIVTDCQYWVTNVNDTGYEPGMYQFDEDGWMSEIYVKTFTGVKDGYYYIDDEIAYNAGLMNYNGGYIYVRSNGQLATGKYWITNHNGLLSEGFYDFGDNGIYYPDAPEGAILVKDVVKNTETDGFGDYDGSAEAIIPQEDGMLYIQVTDITYAEEVLNDKGFRIDVESSDYWERELSAQAVGPQTISIPVKAGIDYILFVNPADIDAEGYALINGTITYKIWSTVDCELEEVAVGQ